MGIFFSIFGHDSECALAEKTLESPGPVSVLVLSMLHNMLHQRCRDGRSKVHRWRELSTVRFQLAN